MAQIQTLVSIHAPMWGATVSIVNGLLSGAYDTNFAKNRSMTSLYLMDDTFVVVKYWKSNTAKSLEIMKHLTPAPK